MILRSLLVLLAGLLLSSCVSRYDNSSSLDRMSRTAAERYQSFGYIESVVLSIPTECADALTGLACEPSIHMSMIATGTRRDVGTGSGMVVGHREGRTYVLTAGHNCTMGSSRSGIRIVQGRVYRVTLENATVMSITDINGVKRVAHIEVTDTEHDLCVVSTEEEWGLAVPIAREQPPMGTAVYSIYQP